MRLFAAFGSHNRVRIGPSNLIANIAIALHRIGIDDGRRKKSRCASTNAPRTEPVEWR